MVIIPFFQRTSGILSRALTSLFEQELSPDDRIHVIVVDDGSPVPPGPEINLFAWGGAFSAVTIARANGGPAAARNSGLEDLPPQAEAVAFLDSDDCWTPQHLQRAKRALAAGADVYFDDHLGVGVSFTHFEQLAREAGDGVVAGLPTTLAMSSGGPRIEASPAGDDLWLFRPGEAALTFARAYLAQTSTIVISRRFAERRFEPRLRQAGEDYLYMFELARLGARVAYSALLGCRQGEGVNHYGSAILSGGSRYLELLRDNVLCMIMMRENVTPGSPLDLILNRRIAERAADLLTYWLRLRFSRGRAPVAPLGAVMRHDGMLLVKALWTALHRTVSRLYGMQRSGAARDAAVLMQMNLDPDPAENGFADRGGAYDRAPPPETQPITRVSSAAPSSGVPLEDGPVARDTRPAH